MKKFELSLISLVLDKIKTKTEVNPRSLFIGDSLQVYEYFLCDEILLYTF